MGFGDKMSREYELRDLLKSQSLNNVAPSSFQSVGGVVFPARPAKFDLNDFVEVVNAFKAVHLPTNGACPIPGSTSFTTVTQADTSDGVTLLTAGANEVLEIMSVYATVANDYGLTTGRLTMNDYPIANLGDIDGRTSSSGAMIFGNSIDEIKTQLERIYDIDLNDIEKKMQNLIFNLDGNLEENKTSENFEISQIF